MYLCDRHLLIAHATHAEYGVPAIRSVRELA
jgi:hypothetical protein